MNPTIPAPTSLDILSLADTWHRDRALALSLAEQSAADHSRHPQPIKLPTEKNDERAHIT